MITVHVNESHTEPIVSVLLLWLSFADFWPSPPRNAENAENTENSAENTENEDNVGNAEKYGKRSYINTRDNKDTINIVLDNCLLNSVWNTRNSHIVCG